MLPKFVHQHLNTTRAGAGAEQEQNRWTQSVWFSLGRWGSTGSWEAPTNWATPNVAAVPQEKLRKTEADGSQHVAGQHRILRATSGRTGSTTPSSSTEAGKSSSEKRTTSTTRSHQWWEIPPGDLGGHHGFVTRSCFLTRPDVKKQDLFALPLRKMRKGEGKHTPTPPSCRVFTPCGLLEHWFPHCSGGLSREALLKVVLWWGNLRQQD